MSNTWCSDDHGHLFPQSEIIYQVECCQRFCETDPINRTIDSRTQSKSPELSQDTLIKQIYSQIMEKNPKKQTTFCFESIHAETFSIGIKIQLKQHFLS